MRRIPMPFCAVSCTLSPMASPLFRFHGFSDHTIGVLFDHWGMILGSINILLPVFRQAGTACGVFP
jgi:hypothetical protein